MACLHITGQTKTPRDDRRRGLLATLTALARALAPAETAQQHPSAGDAWPRARKPLKALRCVVRSTYRRFCGVGTGVLASWRMPKQAATCGVSARTPTWCRDASPSGHRNRRRPPPRRRGSDAPGRVAVPSDVHASKPRRRREDRHQGRNGRGRESDRNAEDTMHRRDGEQPFPEPYPRPRFAD